MNNFNVIGEFISSLSYDRKEIYNRISILENKKRKLSKNEIKLLESLEKELIDIKERLRRFENAIILKLEE